MSEPLEKLMSANLDAVYAALENVPARTFRADVSELVNKLLFKTDVEFDEKAHPEEWRNETARELNAVIGHIAYLLECFPDESDIVFAIAALRTVERVAEFEQITEVNEALDEQDRKRETENPC